jgi:hypothetical protein
MELKALIGVESKAVKSRVYLYMIGPSKRGPAKVFLPACHAPVQNNKGRHQHLYFHPANDAATLQSSATTCQHCTTIS